MGQHAGSATARNALGRGSLRRPAVHGGRSQQICLASAAAIVLSAVLPHAAPIAGGTQLVLQSECSAEGT